MSRLYVIESTPTITGANADHRFAVKPSQVEGLAILINAYLAHPANGQAQTTTENDVQISGDQSLLEPLKAIGRDLQQQVEQASSSRAVLLHRFFKRSHIQ
jgi:molybdopterin-containing oxidoreductase family iron-sulfur binding subunit